MAPQDETFSLAREPLPDSDETGAAGAADRLTEEERKRRRRKIAALLAILVALAIIVFMIIRSLSGHSPLPSIPSELPHHVSDVYGTDQPMGVAVSPSGARIYVTESEGHRLVQVYDSSGRRIGALKPPGRNEAWRLPVYVTVSPRTEDVYVSDRLRQDVDVYGPSGKFLRAMRPTGSLVGKRANPLGLAFGPEGDLYMTNVAGSRKNHSVLVFGSTGEAPVRKVGARGSLWFPNGLALDGKGDLYVADSNDGRLAIYNPAGQLAVSIARGVGEGDLNLPRGVAIDGDRLLVVDTTDQTIKVYRLPSQVTEVPRYIGSFGGEGIGDGQFQYPNGIAVDRSGRIYVTDRQNGRVQVWSY
jgi:DNA-binding beta-propeller fold protein YncE